MSFRALGRRKTLGILAAALASGLAVGYAFLGGDAKSRLARRIASLRRAGEPVSLQDLAALYPWPPPERNAALVFKDALAQVRVFRGRELESKLPFSGNGRLPLPDRPLPPEMAQAFRDYLACNQDALRLLHQAAKAGDCWFPTRFEAPGNLWCVNVGDIPFAERLLVHEAISLAEQGRGDEAAASLCAAIRTLEALRRTPFLQPVRARSWGIARQAIGVERLMNRAQPSQTARRNLAEALRAEAPADLLVPALVSLRALAICSAEQDVQTYLRHRGTSLALYVPGVPGPVEEALSHVPVPPPALAVERLLCVDAASAVLAELRKPSPQSFLHGLRVERRHAAEVPKRCTLAGAFLEWVEAAIVETQFQVASVDAARVGLAVLDYRAEHGALPDSLDALVPAHLDSVPPDPYDGRPLRYRRDGESFVVYSIGSNGKDDGGEGEAQVGPPPDITFRFHWPKRSSPAPKASPGS